MFGQVKWVYPYQSEHESGRTLQHPTLGSKHLTFKEGVTVRDRLAMVPSMLVQYV